MASAKFVLSNNFQNGALRLARSEADATGFVNMCLGKVRLGSLIFLQLPVLLERHTEPSTSWGNTSSDNQSLWNLHKSHIGFA